jgi:hypothetical protein
VATAPASAKWPNSGRPANAAAAKCDHGDGAHNDEPDPDPQIDALIADEARRDALVDDIALLEEKLPGRDRRAHNGDDQQHHVIQGRVFGHAGRDQVAGDLSQRGMDHQENRDQQQAAKHQRQGKALEPPEVSRAGRRHHQQGRRRDAPALRHAQILQGQADADEFRDDGQRVQQKQVDDAECAPEAAEALKDQPRMADPGDGAKPEHHLLIDIENRDQQQQGPQKSGAVILPGLGIGAERAGVIVAHHHDQPGAHDGKQGHEAGAPPLARAGIVLADGSKGALDVADMGVIQDGRAGGGFQFGEGHDEIPMAMMMKR